MVDYREHRAYKNFLDILKTVDEDHLKYLLSRIKFLSDYVSESDFRFTGLKDTFNEGGAQPLTAKNDGILFYCLLINSDRSNDVIDTTGNFIGAYKPTNFNDYQETIVRTLKNALN